MKLLHISKDDSIQASSSKLDNIPDISNRFVSIEVLTSWLDRLVEVIDTNENLSNN